MSVAAGDNTKGDMYTSMIAVIFVVQVPQVRDTWDHHLIEADVSTGLIDVASDRMQIW